MPDLTATGESGTLYAVILAGGKGERFWPLSTPETPKPFLRFFSDRSLLQQTFDRALRFVSVDRVVLVAGEQHEKVSREQLPELPASQILLEPSGRDTAAAIGYAAMQLPVDAIMLVLPADHLIPDQELFAADVRTAASFVREHGGPCTFGIRPDRPETGYGYIEVGPEALVPGIYPAKTFVEKPDRARAEEYVRHGSYFWNSGIFLWKVSRIRELIARHLPELWEGLHGMAVHGGQGRPSSEEDFRSRYEALPRISIDFGVMQKADRVLVMPASFRWDDVGSWNSLTRVLPLNDDGNLIWGEHTGLETFDCILYGESLTMVTAGVRDLVVVQKGRHLLICHRDYADRLKELLAGLTK